MSKLGRMAFREAKAALDALDTLDDARTEIRQAARNVSEKHHGPRGISSDSRFVDAVSALFDEHVDHLVQRHMRTLQSAIFKEEELNDAAP